jgi:chromosome segregation ATPase
MKMLREIKEKKKIYEKNSIELGILRRTLENGPRLLKAQQTSITNTVRTNNTQYINTLRDKLKTMISEHLYLEQTEEQCRIRNQKLLSENHRKQKLQDALVQLLNDTMAEKAEMQIQVNRTKMDTKAADEAKYEAAANFEDYSEEHKLTIKRIQKEIEESVNNIHDTEVAIGDVTTDIDKAMVNYQSLEKDVKNLDTKNHTAKVHLQEHLRRINELKKLKIDLERQITEKRNIRNKKMANEVKGLESKLDGLRNTYNKKKLKWQS